MNYFLNDDRIILYILSTLYAFGAVKIRYLYDNIYPLSRIFDVEDRNLVATMQLSQKQEFQLREATENLEEIAQGYYKLAEKDIKFITFLDDNYPYRLKFFHDAPASLYYKGELPSDISPAIAVVGSRNATSYGKSMTEYLCSNLAKSGVQIISGMAHGIDSYAHRGALSSDGKTYAVLGNGLNICYPPENMDIFTLMSDSEHGGVISEYPLGTPGIARNFPMRNRIISGLSDMVIVVEAKEKSGSLITADMALDQGRDVYAVPGRMNDPLSKGCNQLIKKGAGIITSVDDVFEILGYIKNGDISLPQKDVSSLSGKSKIVYNYLDLHPKYIEEISSDTGIPLSEAMEIVLDLELAGFIEQISGNYYGIRM